ncbi:MAG: CarD family transcriptional regulator [Deltaproteobacteria bacterium]
MQARKEDGRSKKTTKATPQKPTKTTARTSARLEAVKSVKAPVAAKTSGTNGHESKGSVGDKSPPPKSLQKVSGKAGKGMGDSAAKPAPAKPGAAKTATAKTATAGPSPEASEAAKSESSRTNSAFARPSPWSAPVLPPVKVEAAKVETKPDEEGEFQVGETLVYPAQGVVEVTRIEVLDIGGRRQRFYVLRKPETEQIIRVPVSNAAQLRRPITEAQVREIFRILKVTDVPLDTQTWNRRYRGFVEKLGTGSIFAVAEVLRDLSRVKIVKDGLSFSERGMLERARGLIVKEIAVARAKPEDVVRQQIEAIFA